MPNLHTYLHPGVKGMQIRHLPPLLRFIPQFAQICIVFALSKFEANPFFRLVILSFSTSKETVFSLLKSTLKVRTKELCPKKAF